MDCKIMYCPCSFKVILELSTDILPPTIRTETLDDGITLDLNPGLRLPFQKVNTILVSEHVVIQLVVTMTSQ